MTTFELERLATLPAPHGTGAGYNSGCRCSECRDANAARARAKRAKRRALALAAEQLPADPRLQYESRIEPNSVSALRQPVKADSRPAVPGSERKGDSGGGLGVFELVVVLVVIALLLRYRGQDPSPLRPLPSRWRPRY